MGKPNSIRLKFLFLQDIGYSLNVQGLREISLTYASGDRSLLFKNLMHECFFEFVLSEGVELNDTHRELLKFFENRFAIYKAVASLILASKEKDLPLATEYINVFRLQAHTVVDGNAPDVFVTYFERMDTSGKYRIYLSDGREFIALTENDVFKLCAELLGVPWES